LSLDHVLLAYLVAIVILGAGVIALAAHRERAERARVRNSQRGLTINELRQVERRKVGLPDLTWLDARTLSRIIAHTTDDQSIEGLLDHVGDDGITLRAAKLLGDHPVEMSGETWVPRSKVLFVQTVPDPAP